MEYIAIKNNQRISLHSIPELHYTLFLEQNTTLLKDNANHCVNYFGFPDEGKIRLICCIANDSDRQIYVSSSLVEGTKPIPSFTQQHLAFQAFERELHENFLIKYTDHPWLKPVRFTFDRPDKNSTISNYPFFKVVSDELHEVGVGPIHAGVIEPGHFRFTCNGEQIVHLEIQLGFQHRGIEHLFLKKKKMSERTILAENIAGDTVAGHTTAFVNLWESLCGYKAHEELQWLRTVALELERVAIHTGGLSAICTDIAYQLGSAVFGRLRTPLLNYFQNWCGNRFAKSLIRVGNTYFPFTTELGTSLEAILDAYEPDFVEICQETFTSPTVLARLEKTGVVTQETAREIGTVGMAARMSNISRDIRASHPHDAYLALGHRLVLKEHGDVYARAQLRQEEISQSIGYLRNLLHAIPADDKIRTPSIQAHSNAFVLSLVEGWRGEICHCAVTDERGELRHYKIKDPSLQNWLALALAVRNNEISDFPINNKSFDLSYCGHDL